MARNEEWAENWKEYVGQINRLGMIPNNEDALRVLEIIRELNEIIERNTKKESE